MGQSVMMGQWVNGSWVTMGQWVMGHVYDGSDGSWVTKKVTLIYSILRLIGSHRDQAILTRLSEIKVRALDDPQKKHLDPDPDPHL